MSKNVNPTQMRQVQSHMAKMMGPQALQSMGKCHRLNWDYVLTGIHPGWLYCKQLAESRTVPGEQEMLISWWREFAIRAAKCNALLRKCWCWRSTILLPDKTPTVNFGYNDVPLGKKKRSLYAKCHYMRSVTISEVHVHNFWHYVYNSSKYENSTAMFCNWRSSVGRG